MYLTIRRRESTDPVRPEEIPTARDAIVAATAQTTVPRRRHLRLVLDPAQAGGEADAPAAASEDEMNTDHRLASVTYLPTFIPTGAEHDGDVVELEGQQGEEDLAGQVAAALLVPKL